MMVKYWAVFLVFVMLMVTPSCAMQLPENMNKDTNVRNLDYKLPNFNGRIDSYQNVNRNHIVNMYKKNKIVKNNICNYTKSESKISKLSSISGVSAPLVNNDVSSQHISTSNEWQDEIRTNAGALSPKIREFYKNQSNVYTQLLSLKKDLINEKNRYINVRENLKDKLDNFILTTGNRQVYDKLLEDYTNSTVNLEKNRNELNQTENSIMQTAKKIQYYKNSIDALDTLQKSQNNNQNIKSGLDNYNSNIDSVQEMSGNSLSINIKPENDPNPESETEIKSTSNINKNNYQENSKNNTNNDIKFDNSRLIPLLIGTGLGSGGVIGLGIGIGTITYSKLFYKHIIDGIMKSAVAIEKRLDAYEEGITLDGSSSSVMVAPDLLGEIMTETNYLDSMAAIKGCLKEQYLYTVYESEITSIGTVVSIVSAIVIVLAITAIIVYLGMRFGWWK